MCLWEHIAGEYEGIPSQNHRIRHVCTLELVETQHASLLRNVRGNHRQRVKVIAVLHLHDVHTLMYILHEVVEMNSRLGLDIFRQRIEEQIHKHGLSATNISEHIQALWQIIRYDRSLRCLCTAAAEERAKEGLLGLQVERFGSGVDNSWRVVRFERFEEVLKVLNYAWR